MISTTELEYFMEIARLGHLSRAADRLGITQPALSHCLKRMEQEMGHQLFLRSKKGMELTVAGRRLYASAEGLRSAWEQVLQSVQDEVSRPQGLIRLGCHSAVAQYSLPSFMPQLLKAYPDISIRLHHGLSRHLTEDVISSRIDVAIVVNPVKHDDLIIKELCFDTVTIWMHDQCSNKDVLVLDPALMQSQMILRKLGRNHPTFRHHLESSSLEVIARLLAAGAGQAILPRRVVESLQIKNVTPTRNSPTIRDRICLVYRPEFRRIERGRVFVQLLSSQLF